jgi:hypothetical protein
VRQRRSALTALRNRGADSLHFGLLLQHLVSRLAAPTRLFVFADGKRGVEHVVATDPDRTSAEETRNRRALFQVGGRYRRSM